MEISRTIPLIFREQLSKLRSRPMVYGKRNAHWRPLTWTQVGERVDAAAMGLLAHGFEPGTRIAMTGANSVEWLIADLAIMSAGLVSVPITGSISDEGYVTRLRECGCEAIFAGSTQSLAIIERWGSQLPHLKVVIYIDEVSPSAVLDHLRSMSLLELEKVGRKQDLSTELDARIGALTPDHLMSVPCRDTAAVSG